MKNAEKIEQVAIAELKPNPENPRINDQAVEAVKASIEKFGFLVPIVVKDRVIYAGHTRLKAAEALGMKTVPVIEAAHLSEQELTEYMLADNKVAEIATWDYEKLSKLLELHDLSSVIGFTSDELQALRNSSEIQRPIGPSEPSPGPGEEIVEHVKMVQLFIRVQDYPSFQASVTRLGTLFGTDNVTDTVLEALKNVDPEAR